MLSVLPFYFDFMLLKFELVVHFWRPSHLQTRDVPVSNVNASIIVSNKYYGKLYYHDNHQTFLKYYYIVKLPQTNYHLGFNQTEQLYLTNVTSKTIKTPQTKACWLFKV